MPSAATRDRYWLIDQKELTLKREEDRVTQVLPGILGQGYSDFWTVNAGCQVVVTDYTPNRDLAVLNRMDFDEPRLVVTLGLKGHSSFNDRSGHEVVFREGTATVTTFDISNGARRYAAQQPLQQLRLVIGASALAGIFGDQALNRHFKPQLHTVSQRPISASGRLAAHQLVNCPLTGTAAALFRQGQAMALLAAELSYLLPNKQAEIASSDLRDQAIAQAAHQILIREFKNPPSIASLASRVGTNSCTLKYAFHRVFDNTPYGILLDIRMRHAYDLLLTTHCPVGIAADTVGYRHAGNFSVAFTRYFGFSPKTLAKSKPSR
ncbi:MAG: hypothetical protein Kow0065_04150 [Methylomicrobium sp.]